MKFLLSLLTLAFISISTIQAQVGLEKIVDSRYQLMYPRGLNGFWWNDNASGYYFSAKRDTIYQLKAENSKEIFVVANDYKEIENFRVVNHSKDGKTWVLKGKKNYYSFDVTSKTITQSFTLPENAANLSFNSPSDAVAYTIENNLQVQIIASNKTLLVTDHDNSTVTSGQAVSRNEFGISKGIFWSNAGDKLLFYEKDESDISQVPLLNINAIPGETTMLRYPMAGDKSEHLKIGYFQLGTNETSYLPLETASNMYYPTVVWSNNDAHILIGSLNRQQNFYTLKSYDAQTFMSTVVLTESHNKWVEPEYEPVFTSDNEFVYFSEQDGYMNAYLYNLKGELVSKMSSNKFPITSVHGVDKGGAIYYTASTDLAMNRQLFKSTKSGKTTQLSSGAYYHDFKLSRDFSLAIDHYQSVDNPGVYQLLDINKKEAQEITSLKNPFGNYELPEVRLSTIKAADGNTELNQRLILPKDFDSTKTYPVLVYVYGGPHAQLVKNSWLGGASSWMIWLANEGYIVYTVDNRGSAHRGFEFENVIHRQLGTSEMEDQLKGVDYLKSLNYVDTTNLSVHGWSFGGYMTISLMLKYPGVFSNAVAGGPVTNWRMYEIMYGERYMDTPMENSVGYDSTNLANFTNNIQGDLLIIHGGIDPVVVPQHTFNIIRSFEKNKKQVDMYIYPTWEHNVLGGDRSHLYRKVLDYITK